MATPVDYDPFSAAPTSGGTPVDYDPWQQQLKARTREAFGEGGVVPGLYPSEGAKTPKERGEEIMGATGAGAVLGAAAPKILKAVPYAPVKALGAVLEAAPAASRALGGAFTGLGSEAAGQLAEYRGAGRGTAEAARLLGGGGAGAVEKLVGAVPGKIGAAYRGIKKLATGGPEETMSEATRRAVQAFRGEGRTAEPATDLYQQMRTGLAGETTAAETGARKMVGEAEDITRRAGAAGAEATRTAERWAQEAKTELNRIGKPKEATDVGTELRNKINKVRDEEKAVLEKQYRADEEARNKIVAAREAKGESMADFPEYSEMLQDLRNKLLIGKKAQEQTLRPVADPGTLNAYNNIYESLVNKRVATALDEFGNPTNYKTFKNSFEAIDDVRRKLADRAFGKEVEGYNGISTNIAKEYWQRLREMQIKFAGEAQSNLLRNYGEGMELSAKFKGGRGAKATAVDKYDKERFVTDPSALPKSYFSSRTGVDDLIELTNGDKKLVEDAARSYVARELEGKSAAQTASWINSNSDFLSHESMNGVKSAANAYLNTLERAERGTKAMERAGAAQIKRGEAAAAETVKGAETLVADAQKRADAILKSETPAKLFSEMLTGADPVGNMRIVAQYVAKDPAGQKTVERAVRQAVADVSPANIERQWVNGVRPAMEGSGLMTPQQLTRMDAEIQRIAESLRKNPRATLRWYQNMIYNALLGETASVTGRGVASGYNSLKGMTNPMAY